MLSLRFINCKLAFLFNSLIHDTRGTLVFYYIKLQMLISIRFQMLFHPLYFEYFSQVPHGTFSLSIFLCVSCWRWYFNLITDLRLPYTFLFYQILYITRLTLVIHYFTNLSAKIYETICVRSPLLTKSRFINRP